MLFPYKKPPLRLDEPDEPFSSLRFRFRSTGADDPRQNIRTGDNTDQPMESIDNKDAVDMSIGHSLRQFRKGRIDGNGDGIERHVLPYFPSCRLLGVHDLPAEKVGSRKNTNASAIRFDDRQTTDLMQQKQ